MNPLVRWSGSKKKTLPRLKALWCSEYGRYIELFAGSACLFFELEPSSAVLADKNCNLMDAYASIKAEPRAVYESLQSMGSGPQEYVRIRALNPAHLTPATRAARFVYLMRHCYGGVYRTNKSGSFNVPYGGGSTGQLPTLDRLLAASELLQRATLFNGDFAEAVDAYRPGDFVYLDPPYADVRDRRGLQYGYDSFLSDELGRLVEELSRIVAAGAHFVLSYADTPEARAALERYHVTEVTVTRSLARDPALRGIGRELMCTSFERASA